MPVTQDRLTRLREFGLSEYAARAYLALLDLGIAEARDVSSISKVPQAKIYHVLEQLHEKGLVVILPEFPKKYAPVPFEEYLTRLFEEHTKAAERIEEERAELAELFRVMGDTDVGDRGFFTVIRGRRNVLAKMEEIFGSTERDLVLLTTAGSASRAAHLAADLRRARDQGARVRVMAPVDDETLAKLAPLAQVAEVRARELDEAEQSAKVAIVLSDAARAFLIHFVPDDGNLYNGKDIGVFTDQEAMVAAIQAIVEPHWRRAATYEQRREEMTSGRAPEFTRVYTSAHDAQDALLESLKEGGAREVCSVNGVEAGLRGERDRTFAKALAETDARVRAILNLRDLKALDDYLAAQQETPRAEYRHLRPRLITRQVILDEREAFISVGQPDGDADLVVHTNSPAIVRSARLHFESLWSAATPLENRRRELELFPDLQPGDLGLGRLFDTLVDAIAVADDDGRVVLWNPAAATVFGHTIQQARGLDVQDLFDASSQEPLRHALRRLRKSAARPGEGEALALRARRRDGTAVDVEARMSAIPGLGGRGFLLLLLRETTDRGDEGLRRAFDASPVAAALLTPQGRSLRVNHAFARLVGHDPSALAGRPLVELTHPDDAKAAEAHVQRALAHRDGHDGAGEPFVMAFLHRDGHPVRARVTLSVGHDAAGRPTQLVMHAVPL